LVFKFKLYRYASERIVAARCANLEDKSDRLNAEIAKLRDQLEDARTLLAESTAKLSDANDAVTSSKGAVLEIDAELATSKKSSGRFQAEVEKELRRVKVDKELLEHRAAELEDGLRVAKEQTVRELQKKRDAEVERDEALVTQRQASVEAVNCKKEIARLSQLVNGEIPEEDYRTDADAASFAADAVSSFNDKVKTMETADLIKLLRGSHIEHVKVKQELKRASEMLEQGLDGPQVALRKELRSVIDERDALAIDLRTWKANQPRYQAMEAERDHMKAQMSKAVLAQKKAEDSAWESKAFATLQYVEKTKYAREVETTQAEKRLMGVLANGAYEDAQKEHRAAEMARVTAEGMGLTQSRAMQRVEEERGKREAAYVKMAEMEKELQAERAKVETIAGDMQQYVNAATEEVWRAQQAHKVALKIATHATSDAVAAKSAFDQERVAAKSMYSRETSIRQQAARAIADERAKSQEMVVERYLAQHDVGQAARAADNMAAAPGGARGDGGSGGWGGGADGARPGGYVGGGSVRPRSVMSRERAVEQARLAREGPAAAAAMMAASTAAAARQHGMGGGTGLADGTGVGLDPIASAAATARAFGHDPAAAAMAAAVAGMSHRADGVSAAMNLAADAAAAGNHHAAFAPTYGDNLLNATGQLQAQSAQERSAAASVDDWGEAHAGMVRHNNSHQNRLHNQMGILRNQTPGAFMPGGTAINGGPTQATQAMRAERLAMQNRMVTQQEADRKDEGGAASGSWFPSLW
jgi:hypothetical protein